MLLATITHYISQLIKSISRALQKSLSYFNGTVISKSFVPSSHVLLVNFTLRLNDLMIALVALKSKIATLPSKVDTSL